MPNTIEIGGFGSAKDEEVIITFDQPVRAGDVTIGLMRIDFATDDPALFLSSAASDPRFNGELNGPDKSPPTLESAG